MKNKRRGGGVPRNMRPPQAVKKQAPQDPPEQEEEDLDRAGRSWSGSGDETLPGGFTEDYLEEEAVGITEEQSARIERLISYILGLQDDRECRFIGGRHGASRVVDLPPNLSPEDQVNARRELRELMIQESEGGALVLRHQNQVTGAVTHCGFSFSPEGIEKLPEDILRMLMARQAGVPGYPMLFEEADVDLS